MGRVHTLVVVFGGTAVVADDGRGLTPKLVFTFQQLKRQLLLKWLPSGPMSNTVFIMAALKREETHIGSANVECLTLLWVLLDQSTLSGL